MKRKMEIQCKVFKCGSIERHYHYTLIVFPCSSDNWAGEKRIGALPLPQLLFDVRAIVYLGLEAAIYRWQKNGLVSVQGRHQIDLCLTLIDILACYSDSSVAGVDAETQGREDHETCCYFLNIVAVRSVRIPFHLCRDSVSYLPLLLAKLHQKSLRAPRRFLQRKNGSD